MSGKRMTKAQVITEIAEFSELDKKSVARVFDGLTELIKKQLGSRGPGEFVIPGLLKLKAVKKPATKDRPGINPFTKQPITIKGKPATKKISPSADRLNVVPYPKPGTGMHRSTASSMPTSSHVSQLVARRIHSRGPLVNTERLLEMSGRSESNRYRSRWQRQRDLGATS